MRARSLGENPLGFPSFVPIITIATNMVIVITMTIIFIALFQRVIAVSFLLLFRLFKPHQDDCLSSTALVQVSVLGTYTNVIILFRQKD